MPRQQLANLVGALAAAQTAQRETDRHARRGAERRRAPEPALIPRSPLPTASLPPCFTCAVRSLNTCSPNCWESAEAGSPAPSPRPAGFWTSTDTTSHPPPHGSTPPPTSSPSSQTPTQHPPRSQTLRVNYLRTLSCFTAVDGQAFASRARSSHSHGSAARPSTTPRRFASRPSPSEAFTVTFTTR